MGRLLLVTFMIVPLIEIGLFIVIGNAIGLWPTLLGVLVAAVVGSFVLRIQGVALFRDIHGTVSRGALPARALADAMMVGIAGVLLLTPGYFTDLTGLVLLVPAVRRAIYDFLRSRIAIVTAGPARSPGGAKPGGPGTIDLDDEEWRPR